MSKFSFISLRRTIFFNWIFHFLDWFTTEPARYTGQTGRYTGLDRLRYVIWIQIWVRPVPDRTGKPVPDLASSVRSVGSVNP
jgi:hypothetical protein